MWGKSWKELERRVKYVEVLLKEFTDAMVLNGRKVYGRLNKLENKVDGVWKETEEEWTQLPRVGDLVVNVENGNDIRRVFENHYGFMFVGKDFRTVYARNQLKDSLKEWKVIARKGDLK